jgi:hypothetical protein
LVRNIAGDVNATLSPKNIFCQCCGMQLRATPAEREYKEKMRAKKKPITVYNDDDCLGQKMTIDKITVNLYTCYKCNYQWTSWNGNQRAEEPIPKY